MKIIMTGGGTGGHIYPAVAIADKIKRKHPDAEILFVGTTRGSEKDLVPRSGYPIRFITVTGWNRKKPWTILKTIKDYLAGEAQAKAILREFSPDAVIGTGGYVCGPVVRVAHKMGIRTFLHEQNALPGLTNKLLERSVEKVFLAYEEALPYFKQPQKCKVTGNPLRKEFLFAGLTDCREKLGIEPTEVSILCFGGSLGAGAINRCMLELAPKLTALPKIRLTLVTGKHHYDEAIKALRFSGIEQDSRMTVLDYTDRMPEYLHAADLVISRAGALTVSEITACGKPSILIPSPNVTGNHQYYNAKAVSEKGGAVLLEEKDLTADHLLGVILRLVNHRDALNAMARASLSAGRTDSVDLIYDELLLK